MTVFDSTDYSNKKGIYQDLYRTLDSEKKHEQTFQQLRQRKGIYKDLYRTLEEDKNINENPLHKYPLKALVYSNDIGEALRPVVGALCAKLSWIPSIIYTAIALLSKTFNSQNNQSKSNSFSKEIIFQVLASFLMPLLVLKSAHKATNKFIDQISEKTKNKLKNRLGKINWINNIEAKFKNSKSSGYRNLCLSTVGLFFLAITVRPIDSIVEKCLDSIYGKKEFNYNKRCIHKA